MKLPGSRLNLGARLVLSSLVLEALMLVLLVAKSLSLMEESLVEQTRHHLATQAPQLSAALAAPLAQHDYGTAQEILDEILAAKEFRYLVLFDVQGNRVAGAGMPGALPRLDADLLEVGGDGVYDAQLAVILGNHTYGILRYGLPMDFLAAARERMSNVSGGIAVAALVSTWIILAFVGYWFTRRLTRLTDASRSLAAGRFDVALPPPAEDEVGQLSIAFQEMATQLERRVQELKESEQRLYAISHYTYDLELWIDSNGRTIWVNPSALRMTGYTPEECLAMDSFPLSLVVEEDRQDAVWRLREAVNGAPGEGYQFRLRRRDGQIFWAAANWQPLYDAQGKMLGVRASLRDISELKRIEADMLESLRRLKESEATAHRYLGEAEQERARLMALLSAMNTGILFVGANGRVIYHNPAFRQIWGIDETTPLVGMDVTQALEHSGGELAKPDNFARHVLHVLETREVSDSYEVQMRDGRTVTQVNHPVRDRDGQFIGYLWIYEDVTQERQTAQQLLYLAERDSLTGLYNRHRFQDELARAVDESARHKSTCALLFFDLDEFKAINDHFGHRAGDALLIRVAGEVSNVVRRHEALFRLGGDEFAVIMPFANLEQAQVLAERIVHAIRHVPFRFEGQSLGISSSLGIALFPDHATDMDQLVAYADAAMYQAKEAGKNTWRLYRADLDQTPEMLNRLSWHDRLTQAIQYNRFELHFQGVHNATDRHLGHLEALIRLRDEESGELIMPGAFIPVAEKSLKIVEIDRWVLRRVVSLLAERPAMPPVAVNLSGRSFDDPGMPGYIAELLRETSVDPRRLLVEITETAAVSDLTDAQRFIEAIKQTGCLVCLDDFGAGFASFAYLKHINVDAIKIDGMFIRNLPQDHDNQVFVRGMVEVARGLGKITIAECVEDETTLRLLASMGVDRAQGFHLGRPQADHPAVTAPA